MNQGQLFEKYREPIIPPARSRDADDDTSHEAAERMNRSGKAGRHCQMVLKAVAGHPHCTAGEIGELSGLGHIEAQRRLSDLYRAGEVAKGPKRRCSVKNTTMVTWRHNA